MANITYLLGAGASFHALPILNEFPKRIERMIKTIKSFYGIGVNTNEEAKGNDESENFIKLYTRNHNRGESQKELADELDNAFLGDKKKFIEDLEWLLKASKDQLSVDTYAKILFEKGDYKEFEKFKNILSVYLVLEQMQNPVDKRYGNFFASIIKARRFPDHVRVLSWNYDLQFEFSYAEFSNDDRLDANHSILPIVTKHSTLGKLMITNLESIS